jgi:HK97 family phage major capsid protein
MKEKKMERPETSIINESVSKRFTAYLKGTCSQLDDQDGFKVPHEIRSYIDEKIMTLAPIKALAKRTFSSSDRLEIVVDADSSLTAGWITNDQLELEDNSRITKHQIDLHQIYARPKVTQKLIEDSVVSVEDFIKEKIIIQMAATENRAFLLGTGDCQPKGILSYELSEEQGEEKIECILIDKANGIDNVETLINLMDKLPSQYLPRAVWIMARTTASSLKLLRDARNHRFVWQNAIMQGMPDTIFGYPVIISDDMPKISRENGSTPIIFGNLYEGYQIAEKPDISILRDPYNAKPFVEFFATKRIGGDVVNFDAIKALRCE